MIDSHGHINDPKLLEDLEGVLARSKEAGVTDIIVPGYDLKSSFKALELAEKYDVAEGYRLVTNNGSQAGQVIFHLHFHLIGGRRLGGLA